MKMNINRERIPRPLALLASLALIGLLTACSSGGEGGSQTPLGGIDGGGFAKGTVSGFGSVIVNGVTFSTTNATFTINGQPGTQADLRVGDVVTVVGSITGTTGTATSVTFDDDVDGPVQSVDVAQGVLVVMGQTVRIDGATSFDNSSANCTLATIQPGTVVEVSGFRTATAEIRATRIECKAPGGTFEVTGVVQALDTNQRRFQIGALTVDYSQAQLQNFPNGAPANGQNVEAKGTSFSGGTLSATRVELKSSLFPANNGAHIEIEGLVTRFASATDFDVGGQRVTTNGSTQLENCSAPLNLPLNAYVEVEGTLNAGTFTATEVECKVGSNLRLAAPVDAVNAAGNSLTALGITIQLSSATRMEDKSDADLSPFRIGDLRVGDFVEVRGSTGSVANSINAALLERDDPEDDVELRGPAASVAQPGLAILGVSIVTNGGTAFRDEADAPISGAEFFARAAGRTVKVQGVVVNGAIVADEIELET